MNQCTVVDAIGALIRSMLPTNWDVQVWIGVNHTSWDIGANPAPPTGRPPLSISLEETELIINNSEIYNKRLAKARFDINQPGSIEAFTTDLQSHIEQCCNTTTQ